MIENRAVFLAYLFFKVAIVSFLFGLLYFIITEYQILSNLKLANIGVIISALFFIVEYLVQPTYYKFDFSSDELCLSYYDPNYPRFPIKSIFLSEVEQHEVIKKHEFDGYSISDAKGIRAKKIIIRKIKNGELFKSKAIRLSALPIDKLEDLKSQLAHFGLKEIDHIHNRQLN